MGNGQVMLQTARQIVVECIQYVHAFRGHLANFYLVAFFVILKVKYFSVWHG